jgi:phosphatidylglycerol lysyltransferase
MHIKNLKYLLSLIVSLYLMNKISKEIYINLSQLKILKDEINIFILILIVFLPIFYFLSLKLIYLVNNFKKVNFYQALQATVIAYTYNLFLPSKSGDFFRHKYLDLEITFKKFFNINIVEKLISLFVLIILVFLSFLLSDMNISKVINLSKLNISFIFILLLILTLYIVRKFINKENYLKSKIFKFLLFDILIWSLQFFQMFLIIKILHIELNIFETIFIFGISIIAGLIPISIGGFGVRDYVIFFLFTNLSIETNIFILLILFNLRYLIPVVTSFLFSILNFLNEQK